MRPTPARIVTAAIGVCFAAMATTAQVSAKQTSRQAEPPAGWVRKAFDFGAEDISFDAVVPADASVEIAPMEPRDEGALGKIMIVGKVYPAEAGEPVEVTIQAFELATPAAASRICSHEAETAGYSPRMRRATPDLSTADLFATKSDGKRPLGSVFSRCMTRGNKMLAIHFLFDASDVENKEALAARTDQARKYYETFTSSIAFADGRSPGYGDALQRIPLAIGSDETMLAAPGAWEVPINDFRGPLPAELHLLRKNKEGKDAGLVWLSVQERTEQPDLETLGAALIGDYFVQQSADAERPVLLWSGKTPGMREPGVASHSFRFAAKNKAGQDMGDILATLFWHEGRLYVLSLWSLWGPAPDRNTFFSRLPGLTAYDLIGEELVRMMTAAD